MCREQPYFKCLLTHIIYRHRFNFVGKLCIIITIIIIIIIIILIIVIALIKAVVPL